MYVTVHVCVCSKVALRGAPATGASFATMMLTHLAEIKGALYRAQDLPEHLTGGRRRLKIGYRDNSKKGATSRMRALGKSLASSKEMKARGKERNDWEKELEKDLEAFSFG